MPDSMQECPMREWLNRHWVAGGLCAAILLTLLMPIRAVCTNILHFAARVVVTSEDALHRPRGVERREGTADDHFHADHGSLAAALRPPASEPRPTHRRRDRRHRPRSPSLDGAWVARQDENGCRLSRCDGTHGAGTPTGGAQSYGDGCRSSRHCSGSCSPCCKRPGFASA